jgi:hypothetical protein
MRNASDLQAQADFLVLRHGSAAQHRIMKQLADVGKTANSKEIQYWKTLLKLVTQRLSSANASPVCL